MRGSRWSVLAFIDKQRAFFESNPRMAVMTKSLDKMDAERKCRIFTKAGQFIADVTEDA